MLLRFNYVIDLFTNDGISDVTSIMFDSELMTMFECFMHSEHTPASSSTFNGEGAWELKSVLNQRREGLV